MKKKIAIGADHAGYLLKAELIMAYGDRFEFVDFGTNGPESVDYPDFAHPVANEVEQGKADFGVLICGSGNGINMTANKHAGVRAALCWEEEIAKLARQHNDANVLTLPARFVDIEKGKRILEAFMSEGFEGGRHQNRINKI